MADNDIATNPETGQAARLVNGKWEIMDSPLTWTGSAKAAGSGLLHEAVPFAAGFPGDLIHLGGMAKDWVKGKFSGDPVSDKSLGDLVTGEEKAPSPQQPSTNPWSVLGPPTSSDVRDKIKEYVPEYTPKNFLERGIKTTMGLAPTMALAPELHVPKLMASAPKAMASLLSGFGRYAALPGFASEGVKEGFDWAGNKDSAWKEPMAMATQLAMPFLARKPITPNPAPVSRLEDAGILDKVGSTYSPKQLSGGNLKKEANILDTAIASGPGTVGENAKNAANYTAGGLRAAFQDVLPAKAMQEVETALKAGKNAGPEARAVIDKHLNAEYARLTGRTTPGGRVGPYIGNPARDPFSKQLDKAVDTFNKETRLNPSTEPAEILQRLRGEFSKGGDWIDAASYQGMRSQLGELAANAADAPAKRVYTEMRNALDKRMDEVIKHFHPDDVGAWDKLREGWQNKLIFDRAMKGTGGAAAEGILTPQKLGQAVEQVVGDTALSMETHPLGQYSRAGQRIITPLPEGAPTGMAHAAQFLPMFMGSMSGAGAGAEAALTGHISALGPAIGLGGAALSYSLRPIVAALMQSKTGRQYLQNQVIPQGAAGGVANPANHSLMAQALAQASRSKHPEE